MVFPEDMRCAGPCGATIPNPPVLYPQMGLFRYELYVPWIEIYPAESEIPGGVHGLYSDLRFCLMPHLRAERSPADAIQLKTLDGLTIAEGPEDAIQPESPIGAAVVEYEVIAMPEDHGAFS